MNPDERKRIYVEQEGFLNYYQEAISGLENAPQNLQLLLEKSRDLSQQMKQKDVKFSIADLTYLVDEIVANCEHLKNQCIEIKWAIKINQSYLYRNRNKE